MSGPSIKDVTEAKCPDDRPHKCLPYGTCYGPDSYCNQQYGDVVSCFPLELRNNVTKILNWCRDVQDGVQSPLNSACQFACEYRFDDSELNIASTTPEPESVRADCSTITRDVISCSLPDKGSNRTNLLNWCYDLLQQNNVSANHSNNHCIVGTDTSHGGTSSVELPIWFIVVAAVILFASLFLNVYCLYMKYCGRRGSYRVIADEDIVNRNSGRREMGRVVEVMGYSKKDDDHDDHGIEESSVEDENHYNRRTERNFRHAEIGENQTELQEAARRLQEMANVQGCSDREPSPNIPKRPLQVRKSTTLAGGNNLIQENQRPTGNSLPALASQNGTVVVEVHPNSAAGTDGEQETVITTKE